MKLTFFWGPRSSSNRHKPKARERGEIKPSLADFWWLSLPHENINENKTVGMDLCINNNNTIYYLYPFFSFCKFLVSK